MKTKGRERMDDAKTARWELLIHGTGKAESLGFFSSDDDLVDYVEARPELIGPNLAVKSLRTSAVYPYDHSIRRPERGVDNDKGGI